MIQKLIAFYDMALEKVKLADFVVPLAFRLILAPVLTIAGYHKLNLHKLGEEGVSFFHALGPDASVVSWFGNPDWGLGMPFPEFMTFMAGWTEFLGGILLFIGLASRFVSIPLAGTMLVAALTAHLSNGWYAIAPSDASKSPSQFYSVLGFSSADETFENSKGVKQRLGAAKSILDKHGNYKWIKEKGNIVILQNGIEFAMTYFFMLLAILFMGGGRFVSIDYWLNKFVLRKDS